MDRTGTLHLDTWAGRTKLSVDVIGETPKSYRIRTEHGVEKLVPKHAVTFECAFCGAPADGSAGSMHRDGFDEGPEVALCELCSHPHGPSCELIWQRLRVNPKRRCVR